VAIFGNAVILFETKTKRLTEASKLGDTERLINDVQLGILDAKQQLAQSKALLLSKDYDRVSCGDGDPAALKEVTQVVCVSIMTHEIPSYPLLSKTILAAKNISDIIPITIFDLKVISFYLANAFDFLYYFAVRSILDRELIYGTEQALLAFHLKNRLTIPDHVDSVFVDDGFGQNIDADYPLAVFKGTRRSLQFGVNVVDDIIDQLIAHGDPASFRLFSVLRGMSGEAAKKLKQIIKQMEGNFQRDGRAHDGSLLFDKVIVTFVLANSTGDAEQLVRLLMRKRDAEKKFEQEYFLWLLPANAPEIEPGIVAKRKLSKLRPHKVAGYAMKQRNREDRGLTAFSPRILRDQWDVKQA
jgi:hypothetical protein